MMSAFTTEADIERDPMITVERLATDVANGGGDPGRIRTCGLQFRNLIAGID